MKTEEELIGGLAEFVASEAAENFRECIKRHGSWCESPIERVMAGALIALPIESVSQFGGRGRCREELTDPNILLSYSWSRATEYFGSIHTQVQIGNYRADFYIRAFGVDYENYQEKVGKQWLELVVECDGHDYHERTKEQARRDKARDRWFQMRGITVLRFTGSEIWADPFACVEQVHEAFFAAWLRHEGRGQ